MNLVRILQRRVFRRKRPEYTSVYYRKDSIGNEDVHIGPLEDDWKESGALDENEAQKSYENEMKRRQQPLEINQRVTDALLVHVKKTPISGSEQSNAKVQTTQQGGMHETQCHSDTAAAEEHHDHDTDEGINSESSSKDELDLSGALSPPVSASSHTVEDPATAPVPDSNGTLPDVMPDERKAPTQELTSRDENNDLPRKDRGQRVRPRPNSNGFSRNSQYPSSRLQETQGCPNDDAMDQEVVRSKSPPVPCVESSSTSWGAGSGCGDAKSRWEKNSDCKVEVQEDNSTAESDSTDVKMENWFLCLFIHFLELSAVNQLDMIHCNIPQFFLIIRLFVSCAFYSGKEGPNWNIFLCLEPQRGASSTAMLLLGTWILFLLICVPPSSETTQLWSYMNHSCFGTVKFIRICHLITSCISSSGKVGLVATKAARRKKSSRNCLELLIQVLSSLQDPPQGAKMLLYEACFSETVEELTSAIVIEFFLASRQGEISSIQNSQEAINGAEEKLDDPATTDSTEAVCPQSNAIPRTSNVPGTHGQRKRMAHSEMGGGKVTQNEREGTTSSRQIPPLAEAENLQGLDMRNALAHMTHQGQEPGSENENGSTDAPWRKERRMRSRDEEQSSRVAVRRYLDIPSVQEKKSSSRKDVSKRVLNVEAKGCTIFECLSIDKIVIDSLDNGIRTFDIEFEISLRNRQSQFKGSKTCSLTESNGKSEASNPENHVEKGESEDTKEQPKKNRSIAAQENSPGVPLTEQTSRQVKPRRKERRGTIHSPRLTPAAAKASPQKRVAERQRFGSKALNWRCRGKCHKAKLRRRRVKAEQEMIIAKGRRNQSNIENPGKSKVNNPEQSKSSDRRESSADLVGNNTYNHEGSSRKDPDVRNIEDPGDSNTGGGKIEDPGDSNTGGDNIEDIGDGNTGRGNLEDPGDSNAGGGNIQDPGDSNTGGGYTEDLGGGNSGGGNPEDPRGGNSGEGNPEDPGGGNPEDLGGGNCGGGNTEDLGGGNPEDPGGGNPENSGGGNTEDPGGGNTGEGNPEDPGGGNTEDPGGGNTGGGNPEDPEGGNTGGGNPEDPEGGNTGGGNPEDPEGGNTGGGNPEDPGGGNSGGGNPEDPGGGNPEDPGGGNTEDPGGGNTGGGNTGGGNTGGGNTGGGTTEDPGGIIPEDPGGSNAEDSGGRSADNVGGSNTESTARSNTGDPIENNAEYHGGNSTEDPGGSFIEDPGGNNPEGHPGENRSYDLEENSAQRPFEDSLQNPSGGPLEHPGGSRAGNPGGESLVQQESADLGAEGGLVFHLESENPTAAPPHEDTVPRLQDFSPSPLHDVKRSLRMALRGVGRLGSILGNRTLDNNCCGGPFHKQEEQVDRQNEDVSLHEKHRPNYTRQEGGVQPQVGLPERSPLLPCDVRGGDNAAMAPSGSEGRQDSARRFRAERATENRQYVDLHQGQQPRYRPPPPADPQINPDPDPASSDSDMEPEDDWRGQEEE